MRIDLHCHTREAKATGDEGREVDAETFAAQIEAAGVDLVAITNHNLFDESQYQEFRNLRVCEIWPGIELDAKSETGNDDFHVIVIANPEKVEEFGTAVKRLIGERTPDDFCESLSMVLDSFMGLDTIFIPHYAGKANSMSEQDKAIFKEKLPPDRLFLEPSNLRSLSICAFHGDNMIIGTDVKDWSRYTECTFAELRLPISHFSQLRLLAKKDPTTIQHLLDGKCTTKYLVSPADGVRFPVDFYNDVNILFGEKGTGKTQILDSIDELLRNKGVGFVHYEGAKRDENLNKLLDVCDMERKASVLGVENCRPEFSKILNWTEANVTSLKKFFDCIRTKGNDDAKVKMLIAKMVGYAKPDSTKLDGANEDRKALAEGLLSLQKIDLTKYLDATEAQKLTNLLAALDTAIADSRKRETIDLEATRLVGFSIDELKKLVSGSKGTVLMPGGTGFEEYAVSRIGLAKSIKTICLCLKAGKKYESEYLGSLEGKGDLYIVKTWSMASNNSGSDEYPNTVRKVKNAVKSFMAANRAGLSADYGAYVVDLASKIEDFQPSGLDSFVGVRKHIGFADGRKYEPSNGEKGILLLGKALEEDADVYLIDEPELGMGNTFIEDTIRPKLMSLGRRKKTVIVATHNANIAVRTLPYLSLYREHVDGDEYRTYIGNPFRDELIDINDESNKKNWTKVSIRTLEGGRDAFDERGAIYDGASS